MSYIVGFRKNGSKKKWHGHVQREYVRYPRPVKDKWWEHAFQDVCVLFLYLIFLAILAGISCLIF